MADNKKSFILYCDQKGVWDKLNNEQAGKLIKHIIAYVNDENPKTDDFITELAFEPIKQHLKRDLKKWEKQYEQRVEAGKRSAESRKLNSTTVNDRSVSSTDNVSVNVNGSVNVNATVSDNVNEKKEGVDFSKPDIEGDELVFPLDTEPVRNLWAKWKESRYKNHGVRYKMMAEQAALKRLQGMNYQQIESTILAAISGGWANLYPEKQNGTNGKKNGLSKSEQHAASLVKGFAERWGTDASKAGL